MVFENLVGGVRKLLIEPAHRRVAILEIAGHRALAAVEVESADAVAGGSKRDRGVNCGRGLAGPALFVRKDDEMWLAHA